MLRNNLGCPTLVVPVFGTTGWEFAERVRISGTIHLCLVACTESPTLSLQHRERQGWGNHGESDELEKGGPAPLSKEHVYAGPTLLATHEGTTLKYHHPDHLSTRVETDGTSAATVRTFGQYPFGETWYETGAASKWKFTSYERDVESGLDQAVFRYDSSRLGRFMTADLLAGGLAEPQSLNRYSYVGNDPINFVDPFGLFCIPGHCPGDPPPPGPGNGPVDASEGACHSYRIDGRCQDIFQIAQVTDGTGAGGGEDDKKGTEGKKMQEWQRLYALRKCRQDANKRYFETSGPDAKARAKHAVLEGGLHLAYEVFKVGSVFGTAALGPAIGILVGAAVGAEIADAIVGPPELRREADLQACESQYGK